MRSLAIMDCVNGFSFNAALDPIINDCKSLLGSFRKASLLFLSRSLNTDAHHIVKIGKFVGCRSWDGFIPKLDDIGICMASLALS